MAATLGGAIGTLSLYGRDADLSVGRVHLSADVGSPGALDVYVPLVDWGVRYEAIRLPVRLHVDVRTVDRRAAQRLAEQGTLDAREVQAEARDAIAAYLRELILFTVLGAGAAGLLVALAVRSRAGPRLRVTTGGALGLAVALGVLLVVLVPPRGALDRPQYYAFGPDIPRALQVLEDAQRSSGVLDQELDAQLVGLARLVADPAARRAVEDAPRMTIASDLHNNVLALPILRTVAAGGPVLFAGDLTDRGTPLESELLTRVVDLGDPFVMVTGNHDSDGLTRSLARRGAIVLGRHGALGRDGRPDPRRVVVRVAGVRIAGYGDPFVRLRAEGYRDRYDDDGPDRAEQERFWAWLAPLIGRTDVVMVHEPQMLDVALERLRDDPPDRPLVFAVGHTHRATFARQENVSVVNGGSVGAGGTGGLAGEATPVGLARLLYRVADGRFAPVAADLVSVDPGSGSSTARRERLDAPAAAGSAIDPDVFDGGETPSGGE